MNNQFQIHVETETTVVIDTIPRTSRDQTRKDALCRRKNRTEMAKQAREWQTTFLGEHPEDVFVNNTAPRLDRRRNAVIIQDYNEIIHGLAKALTDQDMELDMGEMNKSINNHKYNSTELLCTVSTGSLQSSTGTDKEDEGFNPEDFSPVDIEDEDGFDPNDFEAYSYFEVGAEVASS